MEETLPEKHTEYVTCTTPAKFNRNTKALLVILIIAFMARFLQNDEEDAFEGIRTILDDPGLFADGEESPVGRYPVMFAAAFIMQLHYFQKGRKGRTTSITELLRMQMKGFPGSAVVEFCNVVYDVLGEQLGKTYRCAKGILRRSKLAWLIERASQNRIITHEERKVLDALRELRNEKAHRTGITLEPSLTAKLLTNGFAILVRIADTGKQKQVIPIS